jgi:hypothetical protein
MTPLMHITGLTKQIMKNFDKFLSEKFREQTAYHCIAILVI